MRACPASTGPAGSACRPRCTGRCRCRPCGSRRDRWPSDPTRSPCSRRCRCSRRRRRRLARLRCEPSGQYPCWPKVMVCVVTLPVAPGQGEQPRPERVGTQLRSRGLQRGVEQRGLRPQHGGGVDRRRRRAVEPLVEGERSRRPADRCAPSTPRCRTRAPTASGRTYDRTRSCRRGHRDR